MAVQAQIVYPSVSSYSGAGQLDIGPFYVPSVFWLLRLYLHGKNNYQAAVFGATSVEANYELYAVQWVPHGDPPFNIVTQADGANFPIRRQIGSQETRITWDATSSTANVIVTQPLEGKWAGQTVIGSDIDIYLSMRPPSGSSVGNHNTFASIRYWWA